MPVPTLERGDEDPYDSPFATLLFSVPMRPSSARSSVRIPACTALR